MPRQLPALLWDKKGMKHDVKEIPLKSKTAIKWKMVPQLLTIGNYGKIEPGIPPSNGGVPVVLFTQVSI